MWEIFSRGCVPYPSVKDMHVEDYVVTEKKRLAKPPRLEQYADDM